MASKAFRDSVHGYMTLPHACVRIIDTPQFQRLRRIKQLSTVYYVFPNASHTRFDHCLGVAHVAGRIMRAIQQKQPELQISAADVEMLQVAGLVHDIGHAVFSHTFERACPSFNHEQNGLAIWCELVKELDIPTEVDEFVQGCFDPARRTATGRWMYNLINNIHGGIDADRLDYCLRDAQIASVKIGFDLDRLVAGWTITADGEFEFDSKLVGDVFAVHRARFLLYDTVYNHPVVKAIDMMMIDVLRLLMDNIDPQKDGDDIIFHASRDNPLARELIDRIHRRKLYKLSEHGGVACPVVAHYGSGKENPLLKTRFSQPLDMSYVDALCPKSFEVRRVYYFQ